MQGQPGKINFFFTAILCSVFGKGESGTHFHFKIQYNKKTRKKSNYAFSNTKLLEF